MSILIITEKANAARRIATILSDGKTKSASSSGVTTISFERGGDEYNVISLRGHILELDYPEQYRDWKAIPPEDLVYAQQIKAVKVKSILHRIAETASKSDLIIIATDYDREGELIGLETVKAANIPLSKVKRARFSALTKGEVENAFANLVEPDVRLAEAAEARQIVDLSWGAVLTRLISLSSGQVGKNFMSIGRVQSPTLKLLVDRDEEIRDFVPVPYWTIRARFGVLGFHGTHRKGQIWDGDEAHALYAKVKDAKEGKVTSYEKALKEEFRPPPFDTTAMQVEANKIGIPPSAAMKLAEDLYTGGYISYPRTENTEYPRTLSLKGVLEKLKDSEFKEDAEKLLAQEKIIPSRGKRRTTDHPPIYPTAGATRAQLKGDKWNLYELIVRRFMATVAPSAVAEVTTAVVEVEGEPFDVEGRILKEKGWKAYYGKYLKASEVRVPELKVGEAVDVRSINEDEDHTKPPFRYNQGSLIQEMDRLQLGTKSTRHDIVGKLFSRSYVKGNNLIPTASGIALTKALVKNGGGIAEPSMTAKLEQDMLKIASGERTLGEVVAESQEMLHSVAVSLSEGSEAVGEEIRTALKQQQYVGVCPSCGNSLTIKKSRNGDFIGCNGYPECRRAYPIPKGAMIQMTEDKCPACSLPQIRIIRRGMPPENVCIDPKCSINTVKNNLGPCPTCKTGTIRMMHSKAGNRFAGCSSWPQCTQTYPLRPRGVVTQAGTSCPECGAPMIKGSGSDECINPDCPSKPARRTVTHTESTSSSGRVGKVVTVKIERKKKPARKYTNSKKSESPALEKKDD